MLRQLQSGEEIQTGNFGGFCPYWTKRGGRVWVADTAEEIISFLPVRRRVVDPVAFLELLQFNYMLGGRTLVHGVRRMPWHATLRWDGSIHVRPPIPHGRRHAATHETAMALRGLLAEELHTATRGRKRVLLLLTGGLDSRVVAGVLKTVEKQSSFSVRCVTWGQPQSRDVAYARRIAAWYDWPFEHVPYDAELTWANINRGAIWGGSEVSGIHLHGMEWFRSGTNREDLALAASFGDSIGRAEFSSVHLSKVRMATLHNPWGLIHPVLESPCLVAAERDRATAWQEEPSTEPVVRNELDMQENYMRRMICHAMDYIRQFADLHQAFTSDAVVAHMWSLSPECRLDGIYADLLSDLDPRLHSLAWARTGMAFDGTVDSQPELRKDYHEWAKWTRNELRERIQECVLSSGLSELGVLNMESVQKLWDTFTREPSDENGQCEIVTKLCSLELSRRRFGLRSCDRLVDVSDPVMRFAKRCLRGARKVLQPGNEAFKIPCV